MAFDGDPHRILGLARDATLDEVKRAYRRLAKANHPDAAGSGGLSRFLAIQAAYEQLVEGGSAPGAKLRGPSSAARRASEADPDRADATRRAYGARARTRRPAGGTPGPGARSAAGAGSDGQQRPAGDGQPSNGAPRDPGSGRRRGKATLGSTSYDDANPSTAEPDWSGASWYGTSSGTYWTINPKEYADPRKHGPEYQARARRAAGNRPGPASDAGPGEPPRSPRAESEPGFGPEDGSTERPSSAAGETPSWSASARARDGSAAGAARANAGARSTGLGGRGEPTSAFGEASTASGDDQVPDPVRALSNLGRALTDPRAGGLRGRVIRAFVGWLPIALGIGWALGEITGCGRFAATCDPAVDPLTLLVQGAALVALLLSPWLASVAASAALGLLVAAMIATLVLSATGSAADEGSRRTALGLLLVAAWLVGLALAVVQRVRAASSRMRPVS